MTSEEERILKSFDWHKPNEDQGLRIENIRDGYRRCASIVLHCCKPSADRTAALRTLHESMMTANKSIACEND